MLAALPGTSARLVPRLVAVMAVAACGGEGATPRIEVTTATPAARPAAVVAPVVVALDPPNGAADVDPARTTLAVTFDRPMHPEGWAWVIENAETAPEIGAASWDASYRTSTVQVKLAPGRSYVVWVNSPQFAYFRDRAGVPATPLRWTFSTRAR